MCPVPPWSHSRDAPSGELVKLRRNFKGHEARNVSPRLKATLRPGKGSVWAQEWVWKTQMIRTRMLWMSQVTRIEISHPVEKVFMISKLG